MVSSVFTSSGHKILIVLSPRYSTVLLYFTHRQILYYLNNLFINRWIPFPALPRLLLLSLLPLLLLFLMTSSLPPFLSRLFRPFTSTTRVSISPDSPASASATAEGARTAVEKCTVAAGCFWGVEHLFRKQFADKGLVDARVGYIGGNSSNPGYRAVCTGSTGRRYLPSLFDAHPLPWHEPFFFWGFFLCLRKTHRWSTYTDAEALQVSFDPAVLPYSSLIEFFYRMQDPTTKNRQGADTGTQYRSGIFYHSPEQAEIARDITRRAQAQWWTKGKIETEVVEAGKWWDAEDYHQLYLERNKGWVGFFWWIILGNVCNRVRLLTTILRGYECPAHYIRKFPDLKDQWLPGTRL